MNVADERDLLVISSGQYRRTGLELKHGGDAEVVVKRLKNGRWRAYEANHLWGYSHLHGGQTHHVRTAVLRDLDGNVLEDKDCTSLMNKLAVQPFIKKG